METLTRNKVANWIALVLIANISTGAIAEETGRSYIADKLFLEIKDVNRVSGQRGGVPLL